MVQWVGNLSRAEGGTWACKETRDSSGRGSSLLGAKKIFYVAICMGMKNEVLPKKGWRHSSWSQWGVSLFLSEEFCSYSGSHPHSKHDWSHHLWKWNLTCISLKQKKKQRCSWSWWTLGFWVLGRPKPPFWLEQS